MNKKALSPVIAISLLVIVSVVAVIGFQSWYGSYSSKTFTNVETKDKSQDITIDSIKEGILYIKNTKEENYTLNTIKVGDIDCEIGQNLSLGINSIDIGSCLQNTGTNDIVLVTNNEIIEKKLFVKDYSSCVDITNGIVGLWHMDEDPTKTLIGNILTQYTSTQGNKNWLYQRNFGGTYQNVSWNSNLNFWTTSATCVSNVDAACNYFIITGASFHPSSTTGHPVLTWRSNISGHIILDTTFYDSASGGGNGVRIIIKHNSNTLYNQAHANGFSTQTFTKGLDVNIGDLIRFEVDDNGDATFDSTPYTFKIYSQGKLIDSSTNNNNGIFNEGISSSGKLDGAIEFDGVDDYVNMGNIHDEDGNGPFSLSTWFKSTASGGVVYGFISKSIINSPYTGYSFGFNQVTANVADEGKIGLSFVDNSLNIVRKQTTNKYNDGLWHHTVATYDGSKTRDGMLIYIDGELASVTNHDSPSFPGTLSNIANFEIGARDGVNQPFNGTIDEVAIYNRTLSQQEVSEIYQAGLAKKPICNP